MHEATINVARKLIIYYFWAHIEYLLLNIMLVSLFESGSHTNETIINHLFIEIMREKDFYRVKIILKIEHFRIVYSKQFAQLIVFDAILLLACKKEDI